MIGKRAPKQKKPIMTSIKSQKKKKIRGTPKTKTLSIKIYFCCCSMKTTNNMRIAGSKISVCLFFVELLSLTVLCCCHDDDGI